MAPLSSLRAVQARGALLALAASVVAGLAVANLVGPVAAIPFHWPALVALIALSGGVLAWFVRRGRLIEPLPLVALIVLVLLAGRALQLSLSQDEIQSGRSP